MFQGAPGDSGERISDDPNLVALIARGERPVLKVPAGFAEVGEVVLTDENLQETDKAGRWRRFVRWIRNSSTRKAMNRPSSRSEEHTSELQSLMRISYAAFCLKKTITLR